MISLRVACLITVLGAMLVGVTSTVQAASDRPIDPDQRVVTIYDQGEKRVVLTGADTVRDTLRQAHIVLSSSDKVEPALTTEYAAQNYTVNIYRARPVMIVDGMKRQQVLSPYSAPRDIARHADIEVYDEDELTLTPTEDVLADGVGSKLMIKRATPVTLVLYGERTTIRTQQATVEGLLEEKRVKLGSDDTLSVARTQPIQSGMTIEIWRNGVQTVAEQQPVDFPTEKIQDTDQPVGYRKVQTPGVKGEKTVTYEVTMKNGQEVARKEIQSVVTKQPEKEVVVVGSKPDFSGDFAAALAKLRSCEGGYTSWNPAGPYYGAYQFNEGTWNSVSSAPYGNATPAEQDAAARALYVRRGWSPWPHCGANLPDVYR